MKQLISRLNETLLPYFSEQISKLFNKKITINVDFSKVTSLPALEALCSLNGFAVLTKITDALEAAAASLPSPTFDKVVITTALNGSESTQQHFQIVLQEDTLYIIYPTLNEEGLACVVPAATFTKVLENSLSISTAKYKTLLEANIIPETRTKIQQACETSDVFLTVDWESFQQAETPSALYQNMAMYNGNYSFWYLYVGIKRAMEDENVSKKFVAKLCKNIVVRNLATNDETCKYCYADYESRMIVVGCVAQRFWGFPSVWDISRAIYYEYTLRKLSKKVPAATPTTPRSPAKAPPKSELTEEEEKRKIQILKEVATSNAVHSGHLFLLERTLQKRCFFKPDEVDAQAMQTFMKKHINNNATTQKRPERFVCGWPVAKINFRGQVQERLMILTDKSIYTFPWNYVAESTEEARVRQYTYDSYNSLSCGAIKTSEASVVKDPWYGVNYKTDIANNKAEAMVQRTISKALKPVSFKIIRHFIDQQLGKKKRSELPTVQFDEIDMSPVFLIQNALRAMVRHNIGADVTIPVEGIDDPISIGDALHLLAEQFAKLKSDEMPDLEEFMADAIPSVKLHKVLHNMCDVLEKIPTLEIMLPQDASLGSLFKQLSQAVSALNVSLPAYEHPSIEPIQLQKLCQALNSACAKIENQQDMQSIKYPTKTGERLQTPSASAILVAILSYDITLEIEFGAFPPIDLKQAIKATSAALNQFGQFQTEKLFDMSIPGVDLKVVTGLPSFASVAPNPLPTFIKMLQQPAMPPYKEFLIYPLTDKSNSQTAAAEMMWAIFAVARAYNFPNYIWWCWEASFLTAPSSYVALAYNAVAGKSNKSAAKSKSQTATTVS